MSKDFQPDIFEFAPEENRFDDFDLSVLSTIVNNQAEDVKQKLKNKQENKIKNIMIVLDDMISDDRIRTSPVFNSIFTMGRHLRISSIILSQEVGGKYGVNRVCRNNCDMVLSFYLPNENDREMIIDQYLSTQSNKIGSVVFSLLTAGDHQAIVILPRRNKRNYPDFCYYYKAPEKTESFFVGKKAINPISKMEKIRRPIHSSIKLQVDIDSEEQGYRLELD